MRYKDCGDNTIMIKEYVSAHGGDVYSINGKRENILDFSANTSPLGMPEGVRDAIIQATFVADTYPDQFCRELRTHIAQKEKCTPNQVFCGNGAADIIYRLARYIASISQIQDNQPDSYNSDAEVTYGTGSHKVLIPVPAFAEYEKAFKLNGFEIIKYNTYPEHNFEIQDDFINLIDNDIDVVIITNPSNPAGTLTKRQLLYEILEKCEKTGTYLILDECFMDFVADKSDYTMSHKIYTDRLIVLKAFTKFYGMAGIRLGYCLSSNEQILDLLYEMGEPWNVSTIAQHAGIAALSETAYARELQDIINTEKEYVFNSLQNAGLTVIQGKANFLLFRCGVVSDLYDRLIKCGIKIRKCGNYDMLDNTWYRICIKQHEDNEKLISEINRIIATNEES